MEQQVQVEDPDQRELWVQLERLVLKVAKAVLDSRDLRVQQVQLAWQDSLEPVGCLVIQEVPVQQVALGQLDQRDQQDWLEQLELSAPWDQPVILDLPAYQGKLVIRDQWDLPEHPELLE